MTQTTCGLVAVLGAPNAGKSTLVNALVGQKVAIVSAKAQTTRARLMGIALAKPTIPRPRSSWPTRPAFSNPSAGSTARLTPAAVQSLGLHLEILRKEAHSGSPCST